MKRILLTAMTAWLLSAGSACAGPLDRGVAADRRSNYTAAMAEFRRLAAQGNAGAQYNLGLKYDLGEGVAQNDAEALKWYRLAATQGDAAAQSNFGAMYSEGKGVAQNDVRATCGLILPLRRGMPMG